MSRSAGVTLAGAATASRRNEPIAPASVVGRDGAGCVAARAVDVQLKSVAADVADCLEGKLAKHASDLGRGRSRITDLTENGAACGRAAVLAPSDRGPVQPRQVTNVMLASVTVSTLQKRSTPLNRSERNPEHSEVDNVAR
jgi:hypothetical protein